MKSFLAILNALVGVHLRHEKLRSLLTLLGVALGVAVVVAISLANEATIAGFAATVERVAGNTTLEVRGRAGPFDEPLLAEVVQTPGVRHAVPRVELKAGVRDAPGEVLTVLGVDIVNDAYFRDYEIERTAERADEAAPNDPRGQELLDVILDPRSLLITGRFGERLDLAVGDPLTLFRGEREATLRVAGLLDAEGPAGVLEGNIAVMDIAPAQDRFGLSGLLTAIDIISEPGVEVDGLSRRLEEGLPANVVVQRPARRGATVDKMLAAFRYNLTALAYIALMVGIFLIYNTVSISVVRRREEIGTLRALGTQRRGVMGAFLAEGALFGVLGAALGVAGGYYLAQGLLAAMNEAVSVHWLSAPATRARFEPALAAVAAGVGIFLSIVASFVPALEAANVPPANTMRTGTLEAKRAHWVAPLAGAGALLLIAAWWAARQRAVGGIPVFGFIAAFLLILGFAALAPAFLALFCRLLRAPFGRFFGPEGMIAVAGVDGSRARTTVAVTGLMIGLAMVISLGIMVGSFRRTVVRWLDQTIRADLFVRPAGLGGEGDEATLPQSLLEELRSVEGVEEAAGFRSFRILYNGTMTNLGAGDFALQLKYGRLPVLGGGRDEKLRRAMETDAVIVSETFAYRHDVSAGDTIRLPVPGGEEPFLIAAIYTDYTSDLGFVVMHRDTYEHYFDDDRINSISLFLEEGADTEAVRARLVEDFDFGQPVTIATNRELRTRAIEIFDRTFAITYVLMLIAMIISILGITTTLLSMIIDRRRELITLRFIGMARGQVGRVVMYESALLSAAGVVLGLLCGVSLSLVLVYVINRQSFGWTIQYSPPWLELTLATAVLFACTLLAGLLPAREAGRMNLRYR